MGRQMIREMLNIPRKHLLAALIMSMSAAFIICGYEFARGPSYTLFKKAYGSENLPIAMMFMPLGMYILLYTYGRFLSWFGPKRTFIFTMFLYSIVFLALYFAILAGSSVATVVLFVFREAYILILIEQYWSFLNSTFSEDSAKKINGPVIGVSGIGGVLGGYMVGHYAVSLGTVNMLLFAVILMLPAAVLVLYAFKYCGEPHISKEEKREHHGYLALSLFKNSPLAFLFFVVVAAGVLSTALDLRFQGLLQKAMPSTDEQTAFLGSFFALVQGLSLILQFIVTPIALKYFSIRFIQMFVPLVHIASSIMMLFFPSFITAGIALLLFKCLDYSLFRAAKEILYIPMSFDARYRTKEVIDTFAGRGTKGVISTIVFILTKMGAATSSLYLGMSFVASISWFGLIIPMMKYYKKRFQISEII